MFGLPEPHVPPAFQVSMVEVRKGYTLRHIDGWKSYALDDKLAWQVALITSHVKLRSDLLYT